MPLFTKKPGLKPAMKNVGTTVSQNVKDVAKIGKAGMRTPKAKKMADGFGKKSLFFKSQDMTSKKGVHKLSDFVNSVKSKKNIS